MKINKITSYQQINYQRKASKTEEQNMRSKKYNPTLISSAIALKAVTGIGCYYYFKSKNITEYSKTLAKSLSEWLGKDIKAKNLKSVISGKELLTELKKLKKDNFIASPENIKNGIFCADLHSHSTFSDGSASVQTILDQVANYADNLNKKSGHKFLFSLTDHDSCNGVKEALKIIAENPKKFNNVKFITGSELSFLIKADKSESQVASTELLVYGFNPFDKNVIDFFNNLLERRKTMVESFIKDLQDMFGYADFSVEELNKTYGKNYITNYQWKVHNYGQTKNSVAGLANFAGRNKTEMYEEIMSKTQRWKKTLNDVKQLNLIPENYGEDTRIIDLCKNKYSPKLVNENIDYQAETNFSDIIKVFGGNENIFGAFPHPYYMTERCTNAENTMQALVKESKGLIKSAESHHQAYRVQEGIEKVQEFDNKLVKQNNLIELGGRDNHEKVWLEI